MLFLCFLRFLCFFVLHPITKIFLITIFFNYHNLFQLSQSFSIVTTFFNYHNLFQLLQSFLIITIFFNYYNLFQLSQSFLISSFLLKLVTYLHENKPACKSHYLTHIFYCQNMTKIFCQFLKFLIYAFYFEFFSFCY